MSPANSEEVPLQLSSERKLSMPLAFVLGLVVLAATGVAAWTTTRSQVERNTMEIADLKYELRQTRETLIRIDENVKRLVEKK